MSKKEKKVGGLVIGGCSARDEFRPEATDDYSHLTVDEVKKLAGNHYCDFRARFLRNVLCSECGKEGIYCCETRTDHDALDTYGFYIHVCVACKYTWQSEEWSEHVCGNSDGPISCPLVHL